MDYFDFNKDFYFKELDNKNEINNSLSLPIGLITALVAGIFYLLTTFDYNFSQGITIGFLTILFIGVIFLILSIYNLIKAYSDFPKGYEYSILADTNEIDKYYQDLKNFYVQNGGIPDTSKPELETYILGEMIKNTGDNQKNNKRKTKFRYNCEKHLISAFIFVCLCLPMVCINYSLKSNKHDIIEVKIDSTQAIRMNINSKDNRNFISDIIKESIMPTQTKVQTPPPKPTPPRSQVIKEGGNPRPKGTR